MNSQRIAAIALRQFYLIRDNPTRSIQIFMWAVLEVALWGFTTKYLSSVAGGHFNFVTLLLGGVLLWEFLTRVMQGITIAFFEDVWARNFLNIFASPIRTSEYILGLIITGIGTSLLALTAILLLAWGLFGLSFFVLGLKLVPFFFILFFTGIALGIFGVGIVLHFGPASEWFVWPIPAVLSLFIGVFYPVTELPQWMQYVSSIIPPTYVFEGLRSTIATGEVSVQRLVLGCVLALFYVGLAWIFFRWVYKGAIQSGLLARYSAESVE